MKDLNPSYTSYIFRKFLESASKSPSLSHEEIEHFLMQEVGDIDYDCISLNTARNTDLSIIKQWIIPLDGHRWQQACDKTNPNDSFWVRRQDTNYIKQNAPTISIPKNKIKIPETRKTYTRCTLISELNGEFTSVENCFARETEFGIHIGLNNKTIKLPLNLDHSKTLQHFITSTIT